MTPLASTLADAVGALIGSLSGPIQRSPDYVEAVMDHSAYEERASHATADAMSRSAEDLLDALIIAKAPPTRERAAATTALLAYVRGQ